MQNAINFFEIPATNHKRAVSFYEALLDQQLLHDEIQGVKMAFFPSDEKTVGGAICSGKGYSPSKEGVIFYLNGGKDLSSVLSKVESLGGKIAMKKTAVGGGMGNFAFFIDTEGNKVGIHSEH